MTRRTRIILTLPAVLLAVVVFSWHQYRQSMLSVIDHDPLWVKMVTVDIGTISSPEGSHTLYLTVHDAGATHSGNFWTWVTVKDWRHGRRLVAEGYSSYPVRYKRVPFPVEWVDEKTVWITFGGEITEKKVLVRLE